MVEFIPPQKSFTATAQTFPIGCGNDNPLQRSRFEFIERFFNVNQGQMLKDFAGQDGVLGVARHWARQFCLPDFAIHSQLTDVFHIGRKGVQPVNNRRLGESPFPVIGAHQAAPPSIAARHVQYAFTPQQRKHDGIQK